MKIGFISLGCSKNLVDSETIMGMLTQQHELVNNPNIAEAIIINTCGFITSAKEEAINTILEMAEYKQKKLQKLIVVGCLAQRYKQELLDEIPEIDRVISIHEYAHLHEILEAELKKPLQSYSKSERLISSKPHTAYLKIGEGCSNCCSYCAIPLIRGKNVSIAMDRLVEQAQTLARSGVKELVLIAQDTTCYGMDLYHKPMLLELLKKLQKIDGFHWIRILYMYPDEISDQLIEGIKNLDKVLPYFDIPMQHASNSVLRRMNRRGTTEEALKMIKKIRKTFDNPTLRTTFIVGFPEESEADYKELFEFVRTVGWDSMGSFTYSNEEDTPAYKMKKQIPENIKQQRLDKLMKLQKKIAYENNKQKIGSIIEVLVEVQDGLSGKYRGRGKHNAPDEVDGFVSFTSERAIPLGSFVKVKISEALPYDLMGEAVYD
ncbi:MAG: 30S ribosomal protein S12 methylthiotransferase RimO [Breznakia sp.]